jgi:hypothetical protein
MAENSDKKNDPINPEAEGLAMAEFFGDADQAAELMDEQPTPEVLATMREIADRVEETHDSTRAEDLIDRLQAEEVLPESIHTPTLVKTLELLTTRLGIDIQVGGISTAPRHDRKVNLTTADVERFLTRGALAASFLAAFIIPGKAFAQQAGPALDPLAEAVSGGGGEAINTIVHWDNIVGLLLLLGVGAGVIYKIVQKRKKDKPYKEKANTALGYLKDLEDARKDDDDEAKEKAKTGLFTTLMGELPNEIDDVDVEVANEQELMEALNIKKQVDQAISAANTELEKAMVLDSLFMKYAPKGMKLNKLNRTRDQVVALFGEHIKGLEDLYNELAEKWAAAPDGSYMKLQLEFEKKKLKLYLDYLHLMKKKWLLLVQSTKNEIIQGANAESLSDTDKLQKEILDIQDKLNSLLDNQYKTEPETFEKGVAGITSQLDNKKGAATELGVFGYDDETEDAEQVVGHDVVSLDYNGHFTHETGVSFDVNDIPFQIDIPENVTAQIWINPNKEIHMNVNVNGVLADYVELKVGTKGLHIKETNDTLEEYLNGKIAEPEVQALQASAELSPESEPTLKALSAAVAEVSSNIKNKEYQLWGTKVDADDDAIAYHQMRVHQEHIKGKPSAVVQFQLEESYWKNALQNLANDPTVPQHSVNFNFENASGGKMNVNQPMRRFNVLVGEGSAKKQASVLITADSKLRAMAGQVRIIFNPDDNFTSEEMEQVFSEVAVKLGLQKHFTPVTAESKGRLQDKLQKMRRGSAASAGADKTVTSEYQAEKVKPASVETLRKKGLHSVYHQFSDSALEKMFGAGVAMSTTTRWSKGALTTGMSSSTDMVDGGATEVFTRIHTNDSAKSGQWYSSGKPAIIFPPSLFERMDCYCYASDKYGSKVPGTFSSRVSPEKLVTTMGSYYQTGHEVMFRDAVKLDQAAYIVCDNPAQYIKRLKKIGITSLGGKPLEESVITRAQFKSVEI